MGTLKNFVKSLYVRLKFKKKHIKIGRGAKIDLSSQMEGWNRVGEGSVFSGTIGYASYMGENCHITANIGRFCSIASRVVTVRGSHPTKDWVSTHPAFFSTAKQCGMTFVTEERFAENKPPITIGNDVWIGDSVLLMDGVTIGDGAIIAAGAVVTKDVVPYSIVAGVPAKEIRKRFPEDIVKKLMMLQWWNKSPQWLREKVQNFASADELFAGEKSL